MIINMNQLSEYLARNKALPVFIGIGMIVLNYVLQFFVRVPVLGFMATTNLFLHLGIIVGLLGILLGDAL